MYKIINITNKNGEQRIDGKYPLRLGRTCTFSYKPVIGIPLYLVYTGNYHGTLRTSRVTEISEIEDKMIIKTMNSVYIFEKI